MSTEEILAELENIIEIKRQHLARHGHVGIPILFTSDEVRDFIAKHLMTRRERIRKITKPD